MIVYLFLLGYAARVCFAPKADVTQAPSEEFFHAKAGHLRPPEGGRGGAARRGHGLRVYCQGLICPWWFRRHVSCVRGTPCYFGLNTKAKNLHRLHLSRANTRP